MGAVAAGPNVRVCRPSHQRMPACLEICTLTKRAPSIGTQPGGRVPSGLGRFDTRHVGKQLAAHDAARRSATVRNGRV